MFTTKEYDETLPSKTYLTPRRYICSVLEEMRTCLKTLNFSSLMSMIEEVQMLANRMEASLEEKDDLKHLSKEISELKIVRDKLRKESIKLLKEKDAML